MNQFKGIIYNDIQYGVKDEVARGSFEKIQGLDYKIRSLTTKVDNMTVEYNEDDENLILGSVYDE